MNNREINLTGRRIGGSWGPPQKDRRTDANRGARKRVNRGDFDDGPHEWDFDHPTNLQEEGYA